MLQRIRVRGLALLSDVTLELGSGLNVLTGETGAGKSLLVSALASLLGKPSAIAALRRAAEGVRIEVDVASQAEGAATLGATLEVKGTRVRASIDGQPRPLSELRSLMQNALILTAQGATRELASPGFVLNLLDQRAGSRPALSDFRAHRQRFLASSAELASLRGDLAARGVREQRLTALLEELAQLSPELGEHAELSRRIELISRRKQYLELCARIDDALSEREQSMENELAQLLTAVRRAPPHAAFDALALELGQALSALSAVTQRVQRLAQELDVDPGELPRLEARREQLERLAARLDCTTDALCERAAGLEAERARLEQLEQALAEVEAARDRAELAAHGALARVNAAREAALVGLTEQLRRELISLSLENARLELTLEPRSEPLSHEEPSRLRLGFSSNPGQPLLPLERIASGGERSRFVLALACAGATAGRTLVFDEIDQGLGGEALVRLADRLSSLARTHQVVCVTHQAALAARADAHFRVHKVIRAGVTSTLVKRLDDDARTLELSRMLAGGRAAAGAKALARRLLAEARSAAA